MTQEPKRQHIYDGEGDQLMEEEQHEAIDRIILLPDAPPSKQPGASCS